MYYYELNIGKGVVPVYGQLRLWCCWVVQLGFLICSFNHWGTGPPIW